MFLMSIATTSGYSEQKVHNNIERGVFVMCVYIG